MDKDDNTVATSSRVQAVETVAARVSSLNDNQASHYDKGKMNRMAPQIQAEIFSVSLLEDYVPYQCQKEIQVQIQMSTPKMGKK